MIKTTTRFGYSAVSRGILTSGTSAYVTSSIAFTRLFALVPERDLQLFWSRSVYLCSAYLELASALVLAPCASGRNLKHLASTSKPDASSSEVSFLTSTHLDHFQPLDVPRGRPLLVFHLSSRSFVNFIYNVLLITTR